jgi:hypothetical protein
MCRRHAARAAARVRRHHHGLARWLRGRIRDAGFGRRWCAQHFNEIIASIRNPDHYAVWHVPIVSA